MSPMPENPRTAGTPVKLLDKRYAGRLATIVFQKHPLYEVKVAKAVGDPAPDEYDTRAELAVVTYSKMELA